MEQQSRRVRFLASVMNAHEARLCVAQGADIIDAKDAAAGALGALAHADVRAIRAAVPASVKLSATIGDPCDDADAVVRDAQLMAATGVDYVKVGLAGSLHAHHVARLADLGPDVLGFRGGLCREHERARALDEDAVRAVREAIDAAQFERRRAERAA